MGPVLKIVLLALIGSAASLDWKEFSGNEYYISMQDGKLSSTWYAGRETCVFHGGDLASVIDVNEKDRIISWINDMGIKTGMMWFGLNKRDRTKWKFVDGIAVGTEMWTPSYPKNDLSEDLLQLCGYMNIQTNGTWENEHCDWEGAFLCKRVKGVVTPTIPPLVPPVPGYCPAGYFGTSLHNKCYKIVHLIPEEGLTFSQAVKKCREGPGFNPDIAAINSLYENAMITSALQKLSYGMWIGLTKKFWTDDNWLWTDNSNNQYENWALNEPGYTDECIEIKMVPGEMGRWFGELYCTPKKGYVCQTYKSLDGVISTPPTTTTNECQKDYTPYWYGCYKYDSTNRTWEEARRNCQKDNAELVTIHAGAENSAMQLATINNKKIETWIGLFDAEKEGAWVWVDNWVVLYLNWGKDEPVEGGKKYCSVINDLGTWHTRDCSVKRPSICKTTSVAPITTPKQLEGFCPDEYVEGQTKWIKYGGHCYFIETEATKTWAAAMVACAKMSPVASLASIHNHMENDFLWENIKDKPGYAHLWIGLYRSTQTKKFHWQDFSPVQYTNWAPGEPNGDRPGYAAEDCVEYYRSISPKMWNDMPCTNYYKGYICKAPKMPKPSVTPEPPGYCPDTWHPKGSSCYYFEPNRLMDWETAESDCQEKSGGVAHLATIDSYSENGYIMLKMVELNHLPTEHNFWIGLYKTEKMGIDANFEWIDGSPRTNFDSWAPGEPNDSTGKENCVEVYTSGGWNDFFCTDFRGYVCKMPKVLDSSAATDDGGMSGGQIAGIVIGTIAAVIACTIVILFILFRFDVLTFEEKEDKTVTVFANTILERMQAQMANINIPGTSSAAPRAEGTSNGGLPSKDNMGINVEA